MRTTLSPAFTGSKLLLMFELVRDCALNTVNYLQENCDSNGTFALEMGEIFSRYGSDVIASSAYGITINSFQDKTNEFYVRGKKVSDTASPIHAIKLIAQRICPQIMKWLNIEYFDADLREFFSRMILNNIGARRKQGINRPDMIDLLMKAQANANGAEATKNEPTTGARVWTDKELISQSFAFFLAGFDTVSSLLVATTYELALNVDVQRKLISEILETEGNLNGAKLTYDVLVKMKYMDMVISEVLRYRPPVAFFDRLCSKNYQLELNGRTVNIDKGSQLWIPVFGYHRDPKYFANPEKFDPERFNDANKININLDAYVPFGQGPRGCLGKMRLIILQIRILTRNFSF